MTFPIARLSAQDRELIQEKLKPEPIQGQWLWQPVGITITLSEKNGVVIAERKVRTGEVEKEEMIPTREGTSITIRPTEPRFNGDYLVLDTEGILHIMDNDGEIATAAPMTQNQPVTASTPKDETRLYPPSRAADSHYRER